MSVNEIHDILFVSMIVAIASSMFGYATGIQQARRRLIKFLDATGDVKVSLSQLLTVVEEGSDKPPPKACP